MATEVYPRCALCPVKACENHGAAANGEPPSLEKTPPFCVMKLMPEVFPASLEEYDKPETADFAKKASLQEAECYEKTPDGVRTRLPRIEELIQFARKCGYKTLGLAHCGGLAEEARLLTGILEKNGFKVVSVMCKAGGIPKERIGVPSECKIADPDEWESMCNPIAQAMVLNKAKVDLAVMLGLCIGHDTLFIKHCERPLTVLAVKDRVLGHNPLAALYTSGSYYRRLANGIE
jgi:uncharacterized metal-binding protein